MAAAVFLDIDGVISDIEQLGTDFDSLIGDVLAPALGKSPTDWGRANHATFPRVMEYLRQGHLADDPIARFDEESRLLIEAMCEWLGVPAPDAQTAARLGRRYNEHVRRNGEAAYDAAAPAIEALSATRDVHLATGNVSWNAVAVLERIEAEALIGFPCGVDLIGVIKGLPVFYERLFAAVDVRAEDSIVVDDSPAQLAHASSLGAATILVTPEPEPVSTLATVVVRSIAEVPAAVVAIDERR